MLLLSMFQNAFGAEHIAVLHAVEFDLLGGMRLTVLDLALFHLAAVSEGRVRRRGHRQSSQHLVVDGQVVWANLMRRLVVWTLDHAVLGELAHAF